MIYHEFSGILNDEESNTYNARIYWDRLFRVYFVNVWYKVEIIQYPDTYYEESVDLFDGHIYAGTESNPMIHLNELLKQLDITPPTGLLEELNEDRFNILSRHVSYWTRTFGALIGHLNSSGP